MPLLQAVVALQVALEELLPKVLVELQLSQEVPLPLLQVAVVLQVALEELLPKVLVELQPHPLVVVPLLQAAAALLQEASSEVVGKGP